MDIDNDDDLEKMLSEEIDKSVEKAAWGIHYEVTKNIEEVVYDPYEALVRVYKRLGKNGGFLGSWIYRKEKNTDKRNISYIIESDSSRMNPDHPHYESPDGDDRTEIMSESIIRGINWDYSYKKKAAGQRAWWKYPRNFWAPTIRVITQSYFEEIMQRELYKRTGWYLGITA
jgi:hypothetical protein